MNETTVLIRRDNITAVRLEATMSFWGWQSNGQNIVNLEIFHKRNFKWFCRKLITTTLLSWLRNIKKQYGWVGWLLKQVIEEFCVSEFSECNQKSSVITPACIWGAQFLSLMGCFQFPYGPLILINLMSICNLTPLIAVYWQQLPDVMLWSLTWILSLYQIL